MFDYIRDPAEIYAKSFATVRAEADLSPLTEAEATAAASDADMPCGLEAMLRSAEALEAVADVAAVEDHPSALVAEEAATNAISEWAGPPNVYDVVDTILCSSVRRWQDESVTS